MLCLLCSPWRGAQEKLEVFFIRPWQINLCFDRGVFSVLSDSSTDLFWRNKDFAVLWKFIFHAENAGVLCEEVHVLWYLDNLSSALFLLLVALLMQNQKKEFNLIKKSMILWFKMRLSKYISCQKELFYIESISPRMVFNYLISGISTVACFYVIWEWKRWVLSIQSLSC